MDKIQVVHTLPSGEIRLLDPEHWQDFLSSRIDSGEFKTILQQYADAYPNKIQRETP